MERCSVKDRLGEVMTTTDSLFFSIETYAVDTSSSSSSSRRSSSDSAAGGPAVALDALATALSVV